jgi:hypothetical protein
VDLVSPTQGRDHWFAVVYAIMNFSSSMSNRVLFDGLWICWLLKEGPALWHLLVLRQQ